MCKYASVRQGVTSCNRCTMVRQASYIPVVYICAHSVYRVGAYINSRQVRCLASLGTSVARSDALSNGSVFAHAAFSNGFSIYNGDVETNLGPWDTGNCAYIKFRLAAWVTGAEAVIFPFLGSIYAVRVYDANLTVEELYAHWLIDKKRFNIPD